MSNQFKEFLLGMSIIALVAVFLFVLIIIVHRGENQIREQCSMVDTAQEFCEAYKATDFGYSIDTECVYRDMFVVKVNSGFVFSGWDIEDVFVPYTPDC